MCFRLPPSAFRTPPDAAGLDNAAAQDMVAQRGQAGLVRRAQRPSHKWGGVWRALANPEHYRGHGCGRVAFVRHARAHRANRHARRASCHSRRANYHSRRANRRAA